MFPGKDLWILPPPSYSRWFARLDWYLNWQMSKALTHRPALVAPHLERLAREYEIPLPPAAGVPVADAPLLISSAGLLPAARAMLLPITGDGKSWIRAAKQLALSMGARDICVFLPNGGSKAKAATAWKDLPGEVNGHFVEDEENP